MVFNVCATEQSLPNALQLFLNKGRRTEIGPSLKYKARSNPHRSAISSCSRLRISIGLFKRVGESDVDTGLQSHQDLKIIGAAAIGG